MLSNATGSLVQTKRLINCVEAMTGQSKVQLWNGSLSTLIAPSLESGCIKKSPI